MNILYQTMVYASSICTDTTLLAEVLMLFLMFFQALFISSPSLILSCYTYF